MKYILFDLDGTLTDPKEGITKSVQYALAHFKIEVADLNDLAVYIGPPLKDGFMEHHRLSETEANEAVGKYRERFSKTGLYENEVYDGVEELLINLKNAGKKLAVASSKPEVFCVEILKHFHLDVYFDAIVGSELNGARSHKAQVIEEAKKRLSLTEADNANVVMVGDRKHDIEGAHMNHISSVGVTFGYGSDQELINAGAEVLAHSMDELRVCLI